MLAIQFPFDDPDGSSKEQKIRDATAATEITVAWSCDGGPTRVPSGFPTSFGILATEDTPLIREMVSGLGGRFWTI